MSRIKIETLTAVHIGSGETLQYGTDFVTGKQDDEYVISIVDPRKVMELIGEDNVYQWVAAIERKEATSKVVKQFAPNAKIEDYSKRIIMEWSAAKPSDTLKEQIHDGLGKPYIPGSSIKGAIRTAILASLTDRIQRIEEKIDISKKSKEGVVFKPLASAKNVEAEAFGANPNEDLFRFLQVGDAYFGGLREVAVRMVNINERERMGFWDVSKSQLIEAISPEDQTEFLLKLNTDGYKFSKEKVHRLPDCMISIPELFNTINKHTRRLLEDEIGYWEERKNDDDSDKVSAYLETIRSILSIVNECNEGKECVLRIGHGSGWRFITGAWAERLNNFDSLVVPVSRPSNSKYKQYDFPKTRRVDDQCELLGFVKLSILEE
jgi:CRISPR type III-A-associated RAMP protein Csm5